MRIGELSRRVGVKPKVIRHYEERGLISSSRTVHGHRIYGEGELERLQIVLKLRKLDFSLEEIRELLPQFRSGRSQGQAEEVHALLEKKRSHVRSKKSALAEVEDWLKGLREWMPQSKSRVIAVIDACCDPFCGPLTCGPTETQSGKK